MPSDRQPGEELLDQALSLQDNLIGFATSGGGFSEGGDPEYRHLRQIFLNDVNLRDKVPRFVRRCQNLSQFWQWVKHEKPTYAERRQLLWDAFRPLIDYLESHQEPGLQNVTETLESLDAESVHQFWQRALNRRSSDPEGAITAARSLLETTCNHIIQNAGAAWPENAELPQLWRIASLQLNLAPEQHQEEIFKSILGNCQSVVGNLAGIRNRLGDAHGTGPRQIRPSARHAELAVNLAGTMAAFLVATWQEHAR